jgi:lipid-A-disaccharide synthase
MTVSSTSQNSRVMIVAGESSGDLHGGNLLRAAANMSPELSFFGVGGERMRAAGCEIIFPSDELSVMGLVEVFAQLPRLLARFRQLKAILEGPGRPELLVLIDFPDFNLRLAKVAKKVGVPVLYYITPKVWAWRSGRTKTIAERVDRLALIFPFEPPLFEEFGVRADYVGNPLLDEFAANPPQGDLRAKLGIGEQQQVVGLFPGSRQSELKYIFETLLETAEQIAREKPDVQFLLPIAPSLSRAAFDERLRGTGLSITLAEENIYAVASACDAILTVSGTVTLQIALTGTPMAIVYKLAPLSYAVGKRVVKISHVGLTNIVAGREVVREFLQEQANPDILCEEIIRLLDDREYADKMRSDLAEVKTLLGEPGCSRRVAEMVRDMCQAEEKE